MTESNATSDKPTFEQIVQKLRICRGLIPAQADDIGETLVRVQALDRADVAAAQAQRTARGEDLDRLALLDPLTELYNRRTFVKELQAELNRCRRYGHSLALFMLVIDNFDSLAEQHGNLTGDVILKVVGNVIRGAIREADIAGRYNGANFIVALPKISLSAAVLVAERLRQRIGNQAIVQNWQTFSLTASLGVASFPSQSSEYHQLMARVLDAVEHAAARGGDRVLSS